MKIKTITCHHVYNYGASLQAYALQHYLESLGHNVEIIDFVPWFHSARYNPFWVNKSGRIASIVKILPIMKYVLPPIKSFLNGMFKTWKRKKAFDIFENKYYKLTDKKYLSLEELKLSPPLADVYVAGSDQIWNTYYENGKEPAYYLDFGNDKIKRISYAASLATLSIKKGYVDFVKTELQNFDAISVRESTGATILDSLGIKDIEVVLDPVFLIKQSHWESLAVIGNSYGLPINNYVLVYDFLGNDPNMISFVKSYAKKRDMPIVSINDMSKRNYAKYNINKAGPLDFLALIKNAECVISCSFHATAFSVLFKKKFYTFGLKGDNNSSRMEDFLLPLGLGDRMSPDKELLDDIDWSNVKTILQEKITISKNFLKSNIR